MDDLSDKQASKKTHKKPRSQRGAFESPPPSPLAYAPAFKKELLTLCSSARTTFTPNYGQKKTKYMGLQGTSIVCSTGYWAQGCDDDTRIEQLLQQKLLQ